MDNVRATRITQELLGSTIGSWTPVRLLDSGKSAMVFEARNGPTVGALNIFDPELVERFGTDVQAARIDRELALGGEGPPAFDSDFGWRILHRDSLLLRCYGALVWPATR